MRCAYVESKVTDLPYFASKAELSPLSVIRTIGSESVHLLCQRTDFGTCSGKRKQPVQPVQVTFGKQGVETVHPIGDLNAYEPCQQCCRHEKRTQISHSCAIPPSIACNG